MRLYACVFLIKVDFNTTVLIILLTKYCFISLIRIETAEIQSKIKTHFIVFNQSSLMRYGVDASQHLERFTLYSQRIRLFFTITKIMSLMMNHKKAKHV